MRILVLQLKRIGDVILTTPLLSALREHVPSCAITLALDASTAALAPALDADRLLVFRRGAAGIEFWRRLAAGGFDLCFDVTGNDRSAVATALSRAKRRITWTRFREKSLRRVVYTDFIESSVRNRHTADHHTDLLQALDFRTEAVPLSLRLPDIARSEAAQTLAASSVPEKFAVIHAGTARTEKYWLPERWAAVIEMLRIREAIPVVLTGSGDPAEQDHLAAIRARLSSPCVDLSGKLSLLGTAAVIERSRLLCAVDSAPVHIADAVGTPLVALFGPTNPFHWRPRRTGSRIVTASPGIEITPRFPKSPMTEITADAVCDAIHASLAEEVTNPFSREV